MIRKEDFHEWLGRASRADPSRFTLSIENDFLPFAEGAGANVISQATYASLAAQQVGFAAGLAQSAQLNKVWRQAAHVAAAVALFMANQGQNALDDGNLSEFVTNYEAALVAYLQSSLTIRTKLLSPATYYINSATGSNITGNGTLATPWQTPTFAIGWVQSNIDLNGQHVTLNCTGNFTATVSMNGGLVGGYAPNLLTLSFASGSTITVAGGDAFTANGAGAGFILQGGATPLVLSTTGTGNGISSQYGGNVQLGPGLNFGSCAVAHMGVTQGIIGINNNYTISAGAPEHVLCVDGYVSSTLSGITTTLTGTPAFTYFILANSLGNCALINVTYVGSATGTRYSAINNSIISTNGGGASYFPGSIAGSTATGGQYG